MSRRLRIMFVLSSQHPGGAERQTSALATRMIERGHTCSSVFIKGRKAGESASYCIGARRYIDLDAIRNFAALISKLQPDVIVAVNPYALMYAWAARLRAALKPRVVVTYHSTQLLGVKERLQMLAYRPLFWISHCTVFVCMQQRRYWRCRAVASRRNIAIYNGIDQDAYSTEVPAASQDALRQQLGLATEDYVIGISAWLRPEKNHVQLVDAVAALRDRGIPARALIVGDGPTRGAVEARARALGIAAHVVVTGAQQDVRPYVALSDVVTICSVAVETFSLAALEAMAMGKPVVHANLGGAAEMIFPDRNGFLFPVGDTPAFVEKLALLSDRERARRMGAAARSLVTSEFSESLMVDRYEQLLTCVTANGSEHLNCRAS